MYISFIEGVQRGSQESERPRDRTERHTDRILPGRPGDGVGSSSPRGVLNLKPNEAQSARGESKRKGVNLRSNYVTQVQQQRPESPTVTFTWHAG